MAAVRGLCTRVVEIEGGHVVADGPAEQTVNDYIANQAAGSGSVLDLPRPLGKEDELLITAVRVVDDKGEPKGPFYSSRPVSVEIDLDIALGNAAYQVGFDLLCTDGLVFALITPTGLRRVASAKGGRNTLRSVIPAGVLNEGSYAVAPRAGVYRRYWIVNGDEAVWTSSRTTSSPPSRGSSIRDPSHPCSSGAWPPTVARTMPSRGGRPVRTSSRRHRPDGPVGALRLALPAALVLWFIWKARGNGLFLLGIPVLMVMRGSVFFEKMKPFWTPGRLDPVTLIMIWLVLVWIVSILRRSRLDGSPVGVFGSGGILPEELPLVGIGSLVVVHTIGAFAVSGDLANAVSFASETSYLLLGYLCSEASLPGYAR